ncbi:histidinol-phosphate transaminase [Rhizobium ruizarguesonis]|uniref:Histidinol-phosphate aminotransferase n=1 Tax=Rhizobium ruizarguesonis TaxID=2081791 RepID=A0AB38IAQ2_9HYPH|nr:histidinol-phosphate transaminase [Rhizobium ruizarguesonis]NEI04528.1 histidinol-phosphate transaminase [Rhizobium ruizarguesonis]NEI27323.1 histidinol-phosphate transaminase [Rhizobium ruizarguesonis]TAY96192.1 histidinol-phosphate transaminase [Rhizobium ruizarguesonis]TAZ80574.1 histidinol-phosphate transaminase [Rhizobium ruizarguesonis]TBA06959.1 histidinol-phosphate transaminase [Rhizobium ruizarguesonis]
MSRYWSPIVSKLRPYVAGEQPRIANMVKLNTNESPYGPSPKALEAIREAADDRLRLYPDPSAMELRETIAAHFGLTAEHVFVGNGSDEVLAHVFQALLKHERPLLYPDVTYAFYSTYSLLYGVESIEVPVDDGFRIRLEDYDRPCGAIIIPNPNAPTGIGLPLAGIEALLAAHPDAVVVIDEAYVDFGGESAIPLISTHPNLLVIQTLSKSRSLAGLRIGFALGQRPLIEALERVKDSFNSYPLDRLAQLAATAAIKDEAWFETCRRKIIASRESLGSELEALGFEVLPSQANFVFARHESRSGALQAALRERGILVRHFAKPRISDFLRISIGTDEECARLVSALEEILAA